MQGRKEGRRGKRRGYWKIRCQKIYSSYFQVERLWMIWIFYYLFFIFLDFSTISVFYFMTKMILWELFWLKRFISFSFFRHYSESRDFLTFLTKPTLIFSNNFLNNSIFLNIRQFTFFQGHIYCLIKNLNLSPQISLSPLLLHFAPSHVHPSASP